MWEVSVTGLLLCWGLFLVKYCYSFSYIFAWTPHNFDVIIIFRKGLYILGRFYCISLSSLPFLAPLPIPYPPLALLCLSFAPPFTLSCFAPPLPLSFLSLSPSFFAVTCPSYALPLPLPFPPLAWLFLALPCSSLALLSLSPCFSPSSFVPSLSGPFLILPLPCLTLHFFVYSILSLPCLRVPYFALPVPPLTFSKEMQGMEGK